MKRLGFMQGRLVPSENKKIQSFPWKNWRREFEISNKIGLNLIEWTIDRKNFFQNPYSSQKYQLMRMGPQLKSLL